MPFKLPTLPEVPGADPTRAVLDSFKIAIAKRVADALPPLTIEQVYQGVDYGKKGVDFTIALPRFRLPAKVDVLAKTVIDHVCTVRRVCSSHTLAYVSLVPGGRLCRVRHARQGVLTFHVEDPLAPARCIDAGARAHI
jgi:hypothetical protein